MSPPLLPSQLPSPLPLCRLDELPDGAARGFDPQGSGRDTLFLVRRGLRVFAYRDACPHVDGAPMAWRKDAYLNRDGSRIVCHAHGAQFDVETGVCLLGPCLGQALTPVALRRAADGTLHGPAPAGTTAALPGDAS